MSWIRGSANAIVVATLVRPVARRLIAKARRQAREHPIAPLMVPAEGLLETALLAELGASAVDEVIAEPGVSPDESIEELAGRSTVRTLLVMAVVAAAVAASAWAIAMVVRRRRAARATEQQEAERDWVGIPIETPADEPVEAVVS
jgi:hypothetical protein